MPFSIDIELPATPSTVYRLLTDAEAYPRWYHAVEHAERLPDRNGRPRIRIRRRLPGLVADSTVVLEHAVPDQRVTLRATDGPTPFTYRYELSPSPAGTRLRLEGRISADGLPGPAARLGRWAEPIFARGMRANLRTLGALANHLERTTATRDRRPLAL